MPILGQYTNQDIPDGYAHQIRDFIRIHWFDIYQYDVQAPALPDEWQPVYFALVEGQALFSHAAISTQTIECNGEAYSCGGLGSVFTYPAFRKRGYGSQVVRAASDYLRTCPFDVSLFWTDPDKEGFYSRWGWEHDPAIRTYSGKRDAPERYDAFTIVWLLSDKAKQNRSDFEHNPVYVGESGW